MNKKIVFHGGFQKTGSTAIQHRIVQNRELIGDSVYYLGKKQLRALRTWSKRLIRRKDRQKARKLTTAIEQIVAEFEASGLPCMLISNEVLFGNDLYNEQGDMLEWMELVLPCFVRAFEGYESRYVFYTRPIEKWLRSSYNQSVLMRQYSVGYREYLENLPFSADWSDIYARIAPLVPENSLHFIDMGTDIDDASGLGAGLLRLAGIPDETIAEMAPAPKANVSLNDASIRILRFANTTDWARPRLILLGNLLKEIQGIDTDRYPAPDHPEVLATLDMIVAKGQTHIRHYAPQGYDCRDATSKAILSEAANNGFSKTQLALLSAVLGILECFYPRRYGDRVPGLVRSATGDLSRAIQHLGRSGQTGGTAAAPAGNPTIAIATCVKNEGPFLLEWIAYNRAIGVTDFVFYSNDCTDGTDDLLDYLAQTGIVEHYANPATNTKYQMAALRDARNKASFRAADWKYVCDVDEFLNIKVGNGTIAALIEAAGNPDIISVSMAMYSNDGIKKYKDAPLITQFLRRNHERAWNGEADIAVKSLTRKGLPVKRYGAHRPFLNLERVQKIRWVNGSGEAVSQNFIEGKKGTRLRLPTNGAHRLATLNHYALRSAQSYLVKSDRGDVNSPNRMFDDSYWNARNDNEVFDDSILRMKPEFEAELARLMSDPEIARLHRYCVEQHKKRIAELGA